MVKMHILKSAVLKGAAFFILGILYIHPLLADQPTIKKIGPVLHHPWGMDLLPNGDVLVTERRGNLIRINLTSGIAHQIGNIPDVYHKRQGGLLDILVSGDEIHICYARPDGTRASTAIDRARLDIDKNTLIDRETIFIANNPSRGGVHFGCRLARASTGPDAGYLFASLGDRGKRDNAQAPDHHAGSIIRLFPDGRIPTDNPNQAGWTAETWSIGHRNPQGMTSNPDTGAIWAHEHGPRGGDEINLILRGKNYGWPKVSHGREYATGLRVSTYQSLAGYVDPHWVWDPSIAPSGMAFYPHDATMFPDLQGHLLVGSLKFRQLWLVRMVNGIPADESILMDRAIGRIRDVMIAPDGSILLLNDEVQGGLYRISR